MEFQALKQNKLKTKDHLSNIHGNIWGTQAGGSVMPWSPIPKASSKFLLFCHLSIQSLSNLWLTCVRIPWDFVTNTDSLASLHTSTQLFLMITFLSTLRLENYALTAPSILGFSVWFGFPIMIYTAVEMATTEELRVVICMASSKPRDV